MNLSYYDLQSFFLSLIQQYVFSGLAIAFIIKCSMKYEYWKRWLVAISHDVHFPILLRYNQSCDSISYLGHLWNYIVGDIDERFGFRIDFQDFVETENNHIRIQIWWDDRTRSVEKQLFFHLFHWAVFLALSLSWRILLILQYLWKILSLVFIQ